MQGGDDFDLTIRSTRHGPLLSDVSRELSTVGANAEAPRGPDPGNGYSVALQWTALEPSTTADAILELNRASNWDEFRAAAADFAVPAQNLVYADTEGHIGYQAPGQVPIRKSGNDGRLPAAGWLPENDWSGTEVPFDALPSVLDPDEGFVVTANQAVTDPTYPYFLTDDWDYGYRSQRIRALLKAEGDLSIDEMTDLQLDDYNAMAPELVPYLLDVRLPRGYFSGGQELLDDWDFHQGAGSSAAAYYNAVWSNLLRLTFHDEMRESQWPDGGSRWFQVVRQLLRQPANGFWDDRTTDVVETRDDILHAGAAGRPRRDDPPPGPEPVEVGLGPDAPAEPAQLDPRGVRDRRGRVALQPRRLGDRRRRLDRQRHRLGRREGLRGHLGAVDADGGLPGRLRRLPVDQPDRRLGARVPPELHRPDRPVRRRPHPALGLDRGRRRRRRREHPHPHPRSLISG